MSDTLPTQARRPKKKKKKLYLPGQAISDIGVVRAKYPQGPFNYQFLMPDGLNRSRVMYCDNPGELEFIAGIMRKKTKVFIQPGPRLVPPRAT